MNVLEFVVQWDDGRWMMRSPDGEAERFHTEDEALRAADRAARIANHDRFDSRVIRLGSDGARHLVRSYGRHPLIAGDTRAAL